MSESGKRFSVFAFSQFYPNGGLGDLKGEFDSLEAAKAAAESNKWVLEYSYCEIVEWTPDRGLAIVAEWGSDARGMGWG